MSIKELFSLDLETKIHLLQGILSEKDYVLIENSEEDISKAVLEYMDFLSNDDWSLTSMQKEHNEYRKKQGHRMLSDENTRFSSTKTHNNEDEMLEHYKCAILLEAFQGTLCAGFLEEHW